MAAMATRVAETVRAKRITASCLDHEGITSIHEAHEENTELREFRVGRAAAIVVASLAQVSAGCTRIPVRLIQGQHVARKRDSNNVTIPLELAPCAIPA